MRGKLIVIEGTDCSGKETQTNLIVKRFSDEGEKFKIVSFPVYESPTGRIIGGPYLGKPAICQSFFKEGAVNVNPKVASLYYIADRMYNLPIIEEYLNQGHHVILDRYVYSNMGHQAGKITDANERNRMYEWLEKLEFGFCELPVPDIRMFLHMPYDCAKTLRENRCEALDEHESDENHMRNAELAYVEVAKKYDFKTISCFNREGNTDKIKTIEEINDELYNYLAPTLFNNKQKKR